MDKIRFENGIYEISNEDYHASQGLSRSALMEFKRSPFHYYSKYVLDAPKAEPTDAMLFGEMVHTLSLEPELFDKRFVIAPSVDRRTKAGKLEYSEFLVNKGIRQAVKQDLITEAEACANSIIKSDLTMSLIRDSKIEQSIYFTHAVTGIQCKVRPDIWHGSVIGDVKTTSDASYRAFQSSSAKYGYYLQVGMIAEALKTVGVLMEKFIFLAVENKPPYALGVYLLDDEAVDYGIELFDKLMTKFARCKDADKWEGYGVQTLTIPGYARLDAEFIE